MIGCRICLTCDFKPQKDQAKMQLLFLIQLQLFCCRLVLARFRSVDRKLFMFPNSSFLHREHLRAVPSVGCQTGLTYHYGAQRGSWCAAAVVGWGNLHSSQNDAVALERSLHHRGASWGKRSVIAQGMFCFREPSCRNSYVQISWLHSLS